MAEAQYCTQHESPDPKQDPCWKQKKKKRGIEKKFKDEKNKHKVDATVQWFVGQKWGNIKTAHNQWAGKMWQDLAIHMCLVDSAVGTRQYSTRYWGLKKFNDAWIGFYPSTYEVSVSTDEDGGTTKVQIKDMDELAKIPSLKKAEKFWFAGKCYNMTIYQQRVDGDVSKGWRFMGECASEKEAIYVRNFKNGYIILNFAMNTNTTRQHYGSRNNVWGFLHSYVEELFFQVDGDYGEPGACCEEFEDLAEWAD